jgi:hypothetical protein
MTDVALPHAHLRGWPFAQQDKGTYGRLCAALANNAGTFTLHAVFTSISRRKQWYRCR